MTVAPHRFPIFIPVHCCWVPNHPRLSGVKKTQSYHCIMLMDSRAQGFRKGTVGPVHLRSTMSRALDGRHRPSKRQGVEIIGPFIHSLIWGWDWADSVPGALTEESTPDLPERLVPQSRATSGPSALLPRQGTSTLWLPNDACRRETLSYPKPCIVSVTNLYSKISGLYPVGPRRKKRKRKRRRKSETDDQRTERQNKKQSHQASYEKSEHLSSKFLNGKQKEQNVLHH